MKQMDNTTFKDSNGNELNLASYRESLAKFPSFAQKMMDEHGTPYLSNVVFEKSKCGCDVTGNGTLQFPLAIKHCAKHR